MRFTSSARAGTQGVVVAVVVAGLALLGLLGAPPAHAQRVAVDVVMTSVSSVLVKGGSLKASGTVTNTGDVELTTVNAAIWVSLVPLESRAELAEAADEAPGDRLGERVTEPADLVDEMTDALPPGQSAAFTVSVPIERLGLGAAGVYPIGVDIRANPEGEPRDTVGRVRTFAPYLPKPGDSGTVDVAFVAPFTTSPSMLADGSLLDPALSDDLAPTGRLGRLLAFTTASAVTPAIDPDLLAQATMLATDGHLVAGSPPSASPADPAAVAFVAGMKSMATARRSLVLPFADTDAVSLDHANFTAPLTGLDELTATAATGVGISGTVTAIPVDGYADAAALDTIAAAGIRHVVLSTDALPDLAAPAPRASIPTEDGTLIAIVADPDLLAGDTDEAGGALAQRQRYLSETALIALATAKGKQARVVALFPRDQRVDAITDQLVRPPSAATWVETAPLGQVATGPIPRYTGTLHYPASARDAELSPTLIGAVREQTDRANALVDISADEDKAATTLLWQQAALRGTSTTWRHEPENGTAFVAADTALADAQLGRVKVSVPSLVTLSGSSGSFPVTVDNQLDGSVTVQVRVTSPNATVAAPSQSQRLEVDAHRRVTLRFTAESQESGVVRLTADVTTSAGVPLGSRAAFTVRATQYGTVGWIILGAGVAALLIAAAYRQVRAHRHARAADSGGNRSGGPDGRASGEDAP